MTAIDLGPEALEQRAALARAATDCVTGEIWGTWIADEGSHQEILDIVRRNLSFQESTECAWVMDPSPNKIVAMVGNGPLRAERAAYIAAVSPDVFLAMKEEIERLRAIEARMVEARNSQRKRWAEGMGGIGMETNDA